MPIQQMLLGVGAVDTKTYVDDVFSTYLWRGNATNRTITNGINFSGEGGMVWVKNRTNEEGHRIVDTVRGATKSVEAHVSDAEETQTDGLTAFNNNGFNLGVSDSYNLNNSDVASWSFRKAPGWFTIKEYTGTGSTQSISHDLGSIPGAIFIKCTSNSYNWGVYHRGANGGTNPWDYRLSLDRTVAESATDLFGDTAPTNSAFTVGTGEETNNNGKTYIAYIFAGGEQKGNASTKFGGSDNDYSKVSISTSDLDWSASDDLTIEAWVRVPDVSAIGSNGARVFTRWSSNNYSFLLSVRNDGSITFGHGNGGGGIGGAPDSTTGHITDNTWHHIAITRDGSNNTGTFWIDGTSRGTISSWSNASTNSSEPLYIGDGELSSSGYFFDGYISNARITIGQKLYTSNFTPSTAPLTTTSQGATASNVKFLGCNDPDQRSSTKTPGAITLNGDVEGSNLSPFSSSTGSDYIFGENEDQNVIKCGSFIGNHTNLPVINLGFEPQFLLWKNADQSQDWFMIDSMRGVVTGGNDARLRPNQGYTENSNQNPFEFTPTGFKCTNTDNNTNGVGENTIFIAIRRPDGYVGKPPELGTDVFAMDTGVGLTGSSTIPTFDSGFPVDMALVKKPGASNSWALINRLLAKKFLTTNSNATATAHNDFVFDSNVGHTKNYGSDYQSWMWKRHAGFDVVTYKGDDVSGRQIPHSLNKTIEMMWIKNRDSAREWVVYHKGLNGGTNPQNYHLHLDGTAAESASSSMFNNTAPTSTHFTVGNDGDTNLDGDNIIAMLFASVPKISAVGSYTGTGANSSPYGPSISLDFQPRFIMIKNASSTGNWGVWDSVRGLGNETANKLMLNSNNAQSGLTWIRDVNSSGFKLYNSDTDINTSGDTYIYYAHA